MFSVLGRAGSQFRHSAADCQFFQGLAQVFLSTEYAGDAVESFPNANLFIGGRRHSFAFFVHLNLQLHCNDFYGKTAALESAGVSKLDLLSSAAVPIVDRYLLNTPYLPRIPDDGSIAGRRWLGCHNSRTPSETCAPGFPPSPWEAVRKYHYSPYRSMRTGCRSSLQGLR